jgi:hypothetical protein
LGWKWSSLQKNIIMKRISITSYATIIWVLLLKPYGMVSQSYCPSPIGSHVLNVNDTKVILRTGGIIFDKGQYASSASNSSNVSAIKSAGLWIGGLDQAGNLRLSASDDNMSRSDFWTGPLDQQGQTNTDNCTNWDRIFTVRGDEIANQLDLIRYANQHNTTINCDAIADGVKYWPARGNPYFKSKYNFELPDQSLAQFYDHNNDHKYNPCDGDYPMVGTAPCYYYHQGALIPAEINFHVFNDNGGIRYLSNPKPLQIEIQVHSYAYSTHDELNNVIFYQYTIINKATDDLRNSFVGLWFAPGLGCPEDDYIGSDPAFNTVYMYNQDQIDGHIDSGCDTLAVYGDHIPIMSASLVRPPMVYRAFLRDSIGNIVYDINGDKILTNHDELLIIDTLVEGNVSASILFDTIDTHNGPNLVRGSGFYNILRGIHPDSSAVLDQDGVSTQYQYSGEPNDPNGWSMCNVPNPKTKQKILLSTGPMIFQPSASNEFTIAISSTHGVMLPCPDLSKMRNTYLVAKSEVEKCTDYMVFGPDAPNLIGVSFDKKITLGIANEATSNNYNESFNEPISYLLPEVDQDYKFEGYMVYQVRDKSVSYQELNDISKARLVFQSDIYNSIDTLYNWTYNNDIQSWQPILAVNGQNKGVNKTFEVLHDQFATDLDKTLKNNNEYHFVAIAYAHNDWKTYNTIDNFGQRSPFLSGRTNYKVWSFKPDVSSNKAYEAIVTRISGEGNPGTFLMIDESMYNKILDQTFDGKIVYKKGFGPINVNILDPINIQQHQYRVSVDGSYDQNICQYSENATWTLEDVTDNQIIVDNIPLYDAKEYIFESIGFSVSFNNFENPGSSNKVNNGAVGAQISYQNLGDPYWFNAVLKNGLVKDKIIGSFDFIDHDRYEKIDKLHTMGEGYFVPFLSAKDRNDTIQKFYISPAARGIMNFASNNGYLRSKDLNNVDIIMTKDKSNWSKCAVVESCFNDYLDSGLESIENAKNFEVRQSPSIDMHGQTLDNGTVGYSYFPGYAVDVETGQRLNVFFSENSCFNGDNTKHLAGDKSICTDLLFNPTDQIFSIIDSTLVAGGQHFIYVTREKYDSCQVIHNKLSKGSNPISRAKAIASITWTSFPILLPQTKLNNITDGIIPNDVTISLRVTNPHGKSPIFDIDNAKSCLTKNDKPVYEFGFEQTDAVSAIDLVDPKIVLIPNPIMSGHQGKIIIEHATPHLTIDVFNMQGLHTTKKHNTITVSSSYTSTIEVDTHQWTSGLYLIKLSDPTTGLNKTLKWIVL